MALVEKQQEPIQKLSGPHSPPREARATTSCLESQLDAMVDEVFNLILGTVNTMQDAAVSHNTTMATTPMINRASFEDILAEEANFIPSHQPRYVKFSDMTEGGFTSSTPHKQQAEVALPPRPIIQNHPEEIGLHTAAYEFRKMQEPKISKLQVGYSSSAGLVFQSWLKDIHVNVEDRSLTQRKAIQLVKDFTTECAQDEVEFYMCMVAKEHQSFKAS